MKKDFDIVIPGATGFTGRLVAEFMTQPYPNGRNGEGLRWAIGGRNAVELGAVGDEIGVPADTPLVVTDTTSPTSLAQLMPRTRLVLSTIGPYRLSGDELLAA